MPEIAIGSQERKAEENWIERHAFSNGCRSPPLTVDRLMAAVRDALGHRDAKAVWGFTEKVMRSAACRSYRGE